MGEGRAKSRARAQSRQRKERSNARCALRWRGEAYLVCCAGHFEIQFVTVDLKFATVLRADGPTALAIRRQYLKVEV